MNESLHKENVKTKNGDQVSLRKTPSKSVTMWNVHGNLQTCLGGYIRKWGCGWVGGGGVSWREVATGPHLVVIHGDLFKPAPNDVAMTPT